VRVQYQLFVGRPLFINFHLWFKSSVRNQYVLRRRRVLCAGMWNCWHICYNSSNRNDYRAFFDAIQLILLAGIDRVVFPESSTAIEKGKPFFSITPRGSDLKKLSAWTSAHVR
jgi:hypothetical protein